MKYDPPPSTDGTMMGIFRQMNKDGAANVYQFFLLDKTGLRIKHFTRDLVGWEDKDSVTTFKMLKFSKDKIEFEGLVYRLKSKNEMEVQLEMTQGDKTELEVFTQKRRK